MDDIMCAVRDMYDESGEYFSKTREKRYGGKSANWPVTQKYLDKLESGQSVLDVGCGSGRLLSGMPGGVEYLGVDFSDTLIEIARSSYPEREFRLGDMVSEEVWSEMGRHDGVFLVASLHHLPSRESQLKVLKEIRNVLRPGGFLFLSVWNLRSKGMKKKLTGVELLTGEMCEIPFDGKPGRHVMVMDEEYLSDLMREAGWNMEMVEDENNWVIISKHEK